MAYERTEVEELVRELVALDIMWRELKSLGDKGDRRAKKLAAKIAGAIKEEANIGPRVFARFEPDEHEKARTLREAVDKFKEDYPEQGQILEGYIKAVRMVKDTNLVYGLVAGSSLEPEAYRRALRGLRPDRKPMPDKLASALYPPVIDLAVIRERDSPQLERRILLSDE